MIPELEGFALVHRSTHRLFHRALLGLTREQALQRPEGGNPILWIAAHMVTVRAGFAGGLGARVAIPWDGQFRRGSELAAVKEWPTIEEVREAWDAAHAAYLAALETVTAEQLRASTPIPSLDDTLLGALGLAALHDSYHVGQLGAARRRHGLDRLVG